MNLLLGGIPFSEKGIAENNCTQQPKFRTSQHMCVTSRYTAPQEKAPAEWGHIAKKLAFPYDHWIEMGDSLKKTSEINYSKLLGFETIDGLISGDLDFQDEAVAAKLGAKVGLDPGPPAAPGKASKE
jgi:hypothetical protein